MKRFTQMNEIHDECENEKYIIEQQVFKPTFQTRTNYEFLGQEEGDIITVLIDKSKNEIVMSDSVMEKRTNRDFVSEANGDVLVGGLGLGMIILAIQDKADVKSITIVEIDSVLRDLVMTGLKDKFNDKVEIIINDINHFIPTKKYDTIYCDIWNDVSDCNWDEMKSLTQKFKHSVNRENELSSLNHWRKKDTRNMYHHRRY